MNKIKKIVRQHYLTIIAIILVIIAIYGPISYYLKEINLISYQKTTDLRVVFFNM